ncbi:MAG: hypothetical protein QM650_15740 [Microlunatus sp.]
MFGQLDLLTRKWWRLVGRQIDLTQTEAWLAGPTVRGSTVGDSWLAEEAARYGGRTHEDPDAGLMPSMAALDGPGFAAADLATSVRDFYEHTARWRMEVWTEWAPMFWPGGELIAVAESHDLTLVSRLFGTRVQQLALPTRPLAVSRGMTKQITVLTDSTGQQRTAGWLRRLRATDSYVYSGCYTHTLLPGAARPSVHVSFPLQYGNVQVFLRPEIDTDGSLWLRSPGGRFGADGCYVVVLDGGRTHAAMVPLRETFHVFVDDEGILRTDHELRLGTARITRLHYKLERTPGES